VRLKVQPASAALSFLCGLGSPGCPGLDGSRSWTLSGVCGPRNPKRRSFVRQASAPGCGSGVVLLAPGGSRSSRLLCPAGAHGCEWRPQLPAAVSGWISWLRVETAAPGCRVRVKLLAAIAVGIHGGGSGLRVQGDARARRLELLAASSIAAPGKKLRERLRLPALAPGLLLQEDLRLQRDRHVGILQLNARVLDEPQVELQIRLMAKMPPVHARMDAHELLGDFAPPSGLNQSTETSGSKRPIAYPKSNAAPTPRFGFLFPPYATTSSWPERRR